MGRRHIAPLMQRMGTFSVFAGDNLILVSVGSAWYQMAAGFGSQSFARSKASHEVSLKAALDAQRAAADAAVVTLLKGT